ncbi:MAG TPA: ADP-ribosylglycohydrolase family protein [Candidatus Limnocylindrales bacterium]|nr:ADP-ribosylglycohydrolase family protein [Candidatus Limnocylindrales bacterium]
MHKHLEQVGKLLVPVIAYGDAAGLPAENSSAAEIAERFGRIDKLLPPSNRFHYKDKPAGTWSDDTQLSLAVAESLIEAKGFDFQNQAEHLIQAFHQTPLINHQGTQMPLGWGGNTTNSVKRLLDGVPPTESGEPHATTNGVLMKLAPLVFWHYATQTNDQQRYAEIDVLTQLTHNSDEAVLCSRVHADVLMWCFDFSNNGSTSLRRAFVDYVLARVMFHEQALGMQPKLSPALQYLAEVDPITPEFILQNTDGKGFDAVQTLAMTYGVFLVGHNFASRVYTAVNLGGDADSIASVAGTLSLFLDKTARLPDDFHLLQDSALLKDVSVRLHRAATDG